MTPRTILVTGAGGQVGRELAALEPPVGWHIVPLARAEADIADPAALERALDAHAPTVLVNAAAYTAVDKAESEIEAAWRGNALGPALLASATAKRGIPLLHISTDYVFDGALDRPYREDDPVGPTGAYGASKLAGEVGVRAGNPRHLILRTAWVFGRHGPNFVKTMLRVAAAGKPLRVVADQLGGPTPAADIARTALELAVRLAEPDATFGTFHYAGGPDTSWHGFAEAIFAEGARHGRPAPDRVEAITTADYPTPARRPPNSRLDCGKLAATYGIARPDWRRGLAAVIAALD